MRRLFSKFFKTKSTWTFHKADLSENTDEIRNPDRGWYRIYPFMAEDIPDFSIATDNITEDTDKTTRLFLNKPLISV